MDALAQHKLSELYRVVADPDNPQRLENALGALAALESRVGKLEVKFSVAAAFMTAGAMIASAWTRAKGG